ncbi:MAG: hypothetical protein GF383_03405 [Candidatus Lokiarchaeota archaeon]|nr:hypothetical protein [Candidatus Lokiarchaeota archaeon]MBD3338681.1 hypothetical protein [Candidatus Lokiarchaeota archaeon]
MNQKLFNIVYVVGLIVTALFMLWVIFFGVLSLYFTFLIFFYAIQFLAGFGLVLTISKIFLIIMDKTSSRLGKKGTRILIVFEIIIPALLIVYAIYKIFAALSGEEAQVFQGTIWIWIDNIIFIVGIASLLLTLYIIPLAGEEFHKAVEMGKFSWWKKKAKKAARTLKKKYFTLRKEYAKAQVQDQMQVKEVLDLWRNKFAINLLLVLAVGSIIFMPIAFICVMYWLHLYIFYRSEIKSYEKIALLVGMIWIGLVASVSPFISLGIYESIESLFWTVYIFYLIGIVLASLIFVKKLLELQGITKKGIQLKRRAKKIDKLEKERDELKKKLESQES